LLIFCDFALEIRDAFIIFLRYYTNPELRSCITKLLISTSIYTSKLLFGVAIEKSPRISYPPNSLQQLPLTFREYNQRTFTAILGVCLNIHRKHHDYAHTYTTRSRHRGTTTTARSIPVTHPVVKSPWLPRHRSLLIIGTNLRANRSNKFCDCSASRDDPATYIFLAILANSNHSWWLVKRLARRCECASQDGSDPGGEERGAPGPMYEGFRWGCEGVVSNEWMTTW
jgi:hypothetical protein